jgi:hypothetical protein
MQIRAAEKNSRGRISCALTIPSYDWDANYTSVLFVTCNARAPTGQRATGRIAHRLCHVITAGYQGMKY